MIPVLAASVPNVVAAWMDREIRGTAITHVATGEGVIIQLMRHRWSLLILDHSLSGISAAQVLNIARSGSGFNEMPILYCMRSDVENEVAAKIAGTLGFGRLLFHPFDPLIVAEWIASLESKSQLADDPSNAGDRSSTQTSINTGPDEIPVITSPPEVSHSDVAGKLEKLPDGASADQVRDVEPMAGGIASSTGPAENPTMIAAGDAVAPEPQTPAGHVSADNAIAKLWAQFRQVNLDRVQLIEDFALDVLEDAWNGEARREGKRAAHKLAGSLGPFGMPDGSVLAQDIEMLLSGDESISANDKRGLCEMVLTLQVVVGRGPSNQPEPESESSSVADSADANERPDDSGMGESNGQASEPDVASPTPVDTETVDVVVVDDDEALAALVRYSLETRGYSTHWLSNGDDALQALAGQNPRLTAPLILLDVDMPGTNGINVLKKLSQDGVLDRCRVIMLTARSGEIDTLTTLEVGAFDHVAKPFSVPELMQRVKQAMQK